MTITNEIELYRVVNYSIIVETGDNLLKYFVNVFESNGKISVEFHCSQHANLTTSQRKAIKQLITNHFNKK